MPRRLKPTQCALWLRPAVPPEKRNFFFRGFNAGYARFEHAYTSLIGFMVHRSWLMVGLALVLAGLGGWGVARLPSAFIPNEDQGYLMVGVQMPDGASLDRTDRGPRRGHQGRAGDAGRAAGDRASPACRFSTAARSWPMPASPT